LGMSPEANAYSHSNPARRPRWVRLLTTLVIALLVWQTIHMLLVIFVGVLLALFLRGLSDWLQGHTHLPAGWSLAVVVVGLLGSLGLTGYLLAPEISLQVDNLEEQLPRAIQHLEEQLRGTAWGERLLQSFQGGGKSLAGAHGALSKASGIASSTFGVVVGTVVCLFVGFYLAVSPRIYLTGVIQLFAPQERDRVAQVLRTLGTTLQRWLLGRLSLMALNAIVTALGLWLLGIPLALVLGILSGLLNFVPNFGPIIAGIPAVLLALMEGPSKVLYVVAFYVGYQMLDGYVLTPLVQKQTIALPPALTIAAQALFGVLLGTMGIVLAVPLAAVILVLVKMLYLRETPAQAVPSPGAT
ncbi:MAG TPA: AI-2E family transporter, partial [Candidatus Sulfotelmatobacter sp.]|nr:AI-2E family transporter [Candidatus Sulfotelmatobacter sp.]